MSEESRVLSVTNRLIRAATALGRITAQVHKREHGLTVPEFGVLMILGGGEHEAAFTSSYIVDATAMDKTKVSRAVSSLDQRGWLIRNRASADRRFEHLALTDDGRKAYADLMPKVRAAERSVLKHLSEAERRGLEAGLEGLDRAFGH
ncbi:MarR family winged helix-turn-helix transcriptional regulator [Aurantimonas sp. VKM B-3413]|uniref:MarR family winged helix-turn-helix transcriptional regulator n=1 Tax=Aurantimonas sp. VKM B-3413 TaxID=2779401 RepID=UPI001E3473AD|nr:MarR family winged helix-turn-helix transcriptional regulator [Aurantimonas sp. VKM B-3413]MCB8838875.1 MarR family winged helix-turn-helix transcriptional regulator [Aurantimonas sp. VKM B-3413]